jgi:hypothetical protein
VFNEGKKNRTVTDNFGRLSGLWTDGSPNWAVISLRRGSSNFTIDMSDWHRPAASGTLRNDTSLTANFPDERSHQGTLEFSSPGRIVWDNNSQWTKVLRTVLDLNGAWGAEDRAAVISENRTSFTVDMSSWGRPAAHGTILGRATIRVTFPDDQTYTGALDATAQPKTITWSNNTIWRKRT